MKRNTVCIDVEEFEELCCIKGRLEAAQSYVNNNTYLDSEKLCHILCITLCYHERLLEEKEKELKADVPTDEQSD